MSGDSISAVYTAEVSGYARRTPLYWGIVAACAGWLALIVAAPFTTAQGRAGGGGLYWIFHSICHQIPERSFHLAGEPFGVCHRCTGLYVGFSLGILLWPQLRTSAGRLLANPRWILAFFAPLAVDWAITVNVAASRFLTGLVAAFPVALFCLVALAQILEQRLETATPGEL